MFQTTNQELSKTVKLGGNMFSDKPKKTCWCLRVVSPSTIFSYNIIKYQPISPEKKRKKNIMPIHDENISMYHSSKIIIHHQISSNITKNMPIHGHIPILGENMAIDGFPMNSLPHRPPTCRFFKDKSPSNPFLSEFSMVFYPHSIPMENSHVSIIPICWRKKNTRRRMARERRGAGSSLVSMDTQY